MTEDDPIYWIVIGAILVVLVWFLYKAYTSKSPHDSGSNDYDGGFQ